MTQLETYIAENENRFLEDLKGWLCIPSISTLPEHAADIRRAAEYAADQLRHIGFERVEVISTQGHPLAMVNGSKPLANQLFLFKGITVGSRLILLNCGDVL